MKTTLTWLSVGLVTLSRTGRNSSPQSLIVDKWEAGQPDTRQTAGWCQEATARPAGWVLA